MISGRTSRILPCTHIRPLLIQGLQESEPEDFPKVFIDPNEVYCSEASPGSDSEISEDPGHPDSPPAAKAPSSPTLYEVVYEAGALERMQGEAGPAVGLISIQLGQYWSWEGDQDPSDPALALWLRGSPQPVPLPRPCYQQGVPANSSPSHLSPQISGAHHLWCLMPAWSASCPLMSMPTSCPEQALYTQCLLQPW